MTIVFNEYVPEVHAMLCDLQLVNENRVLSTLKAHLL